LASHVARRAVILEVYIACLSVASLCLTIRKAWLVEIVWLIDPVQATENISARVGLEVVAMAAPLPVAVDVVAHACGGCRS
jgi:hypothetical protein